MPMIESLYNNGGHSVLNAAQAKTVTERTAHA